MDKLYGVAKFEIETGNCVAICKTGRNNTPAVYTMLGSAKREASRRNGSRYNQGYVYKIILLNVEKVLDID